MNGSDLVELEEQGKTYEDLYDIEPDYPDGSGEHHDKSQMGVPAAITLEN